MKNILNAATELMTRAHAGQKRKYSEAPYAVHPTRVALRILLDTNDPTLAAAGLLHDVLEDTDVPVEEIRAAVGSEVAAIVEELSDAKEADGGTRAERKAASCARLANASTNARLVKAYDRADNLTELAEIAESGNAEAKRFLPTYLTESRKLREALGWNSPVLSAAIAVAEEVGMKGATR